MAEAPTLENDSKLTDNMLEGTSKGKVKGNIMMAYLKAGTNLFFVIMMFFLFLLSQFFVSMTDYFVPIL